MKRIVSVSLAFLLCAPVVRADDAKFEPLIKEAIAAMNKLGEVLESIKDAETAKKADKPLNEAVDKLVDMQKKLNALGKPSEEEQKRIKEKFEGEMKAGQQRLQKAAVGAAKAGTEAQEIIKKAMEKLQRRGK